MMLKKRSVKIPLGTNIVYEYINIDENQPDEHWSDRTETHLSFSKFILILINRVGAMVARVPPIYQDVRTRLRVRVPCWSHFYCCWLAWIVTNPHEEVMKMA
jgi:hypothetical protein